MVSQSILFDAKAFLCWDKFPELSIKLMPIEEAIAFFYPPTKEILTINLFYEKNAHDFSRAVCLLFHEVGHLKQWKYLSRQNRIDEFWHCINLDKGEQKMQFEREAWNFGEELLGEFLLKNHINQKSFVDIYQCYAEQSLSTYR